MLPHRSTHPTWNFVADAPRYYDLTKTEEENDHLGHAWFEQSNAPSTFLPNTEYREEPTAQQNKETRIPIDLQHGDISLDYDDQPVNYTTDVYLYSPSHRRQITKRRDIKTELSRTRHEQTRHLQDDNTMEYTGLEDAPPDEHALANHILTPPRPPTSSISPPTNPEPNQNNTSVMDNRDYILTNDDEQQQQQPQRQTQDEEDGNYHLIKLPLLGRVIISPKATEPTAQTGPGLSPILGTASRIKWPAEHQSPSPLVEKETSPPNVRHHEPQHLQLNHHEETHTSTTTTYTHEVASLPRKRLYSEEPDDDTTQPALKKQHFSPSPSPPSTSHHNDTSIPPETQPSSSPLLQLIARVKAHRKPSQPPSLSPLMQLIARVKSYKPPLHHPTRSSHSPAWKKESVVERAKRVMKETRLISLQWNLPEHQLQHHRRTTITTTKHHDRPPLPSPSLPEENSMDEDDDEDTEWMDDEKHQHRSGSVVHSFVSPYLPVALTVPRSPKFSSDKRSRRW